MLAFCYFIQFKILILWLLLGVLAEDEHITQLEKGEKISLSVPKLTEEETRSIHMPDHLRCDACKAVAYQIILALKKVQNLKSRLELKESEIVESLEVLCNYGFEEYGVKHVDGKNRLSGPGLDAEKIMGMTQMGGRWPHRLKEMCYYYVGEVGEMDIYSVFIGPQKLEDFLCHGNGIYSHCGTHKLHKKSEL